MSGRAGGARSRLSRLLRATLPAGALRRLAFLEGMRFRRLSHSQYGEDLVVATFLGRIGRARGGRLLDIGAYHPKKFSNTYKLFRAGWTGVAVDVDRDKTRNFETVFGGRVTALHAAVVPEAMHREGGTVTLYKFDGLLSVHDTVDRDTALRIRGEHGLGFREVAVPTTTIGRILAEHGPFDLINIDVEGIDEAIIAELPIGEAHPTVLLYEDLGGGILETAVPERLAAAGFRLLARAGGTVILARVPQGGG